MARRDFGRLQSSFPANDRYRRYLAVDAHSREWLEVTPKRNSNRGFACSGSPTPDLKKQTSEIRSAAS